MSVVIQLFFRLFAWAVVPLTWKVLRALGFTAVTYVGVSVFMDQASAYIFDNLLSLPPNWVGLLGLLKLDVCFNILLSAYTVRAVLWGMNSSGGKSTIRLGK
ncbi:hypothetical protein D9M69_494030 [compost metagenome]